MPASLYADFIESGTTDDIDLFLTRVTQMPQVSQNKMLQEKILFLNEKLCNVFEEIGNVRKFHTRTSRFLKALRNKINTQKQNQIKTSEEMGIDIDDEQFGDTGINLDSLFSSKALAFCQKSINELDRFEVYFDQLQ